MSNVYHNEQHRNKRIDFFPQLIHFVVVLYVNSIDLIVTWNRFSLNLGEVVWHGFEEIKVMMMWWIFCILLLFLLILIARYNYRNIRIPRTLWQWHYYCCCCWWRRWWFRIRNVDADEGKQKQTSKNVETKQ